MANFLAYTRNLSIFRTASTFFSIALNVVQVSYFGLSWMMESYFVATTLFNSILSLSQSGQLAEIFVSKAYENYGENDSTPDYRLINSILAYITIFVLLMSLLVILFVEPVVQLMAPGFTLEQQELTQSILKFISLFLIVVVFNSFMNVILQSEKVFGKAEKANLIGSVVTIGTLIFGYDSLGIWALAYGLIGGKLIEFFMTLYLLMKVNYQFSFSLRLSSEERGFVFNTVASTISYVGSTQLTNFIITSSLSLLPPGILAAYKYMNTLIAKVVGLILMPFSNVYFALLNRSASKDASTMDGLGQNVIRTSTFIASSIVLSWLCFGRPVISLFEMTVDEQYWLYILGAVYLGLLIPQSISMIQRSYLMSKGLGNIVFRFLAIAQLINAILCIVLIRYNGAFYSLIIWIVLNKAILFFMPLFIVQLKKMNLLFSMSNFAGRTAISIAVVGVALLLSQYPYNWFVNTGCFLLGAVFLIPRVLRGIKALKSHDS